MPFEIIVEPFNVWDKLNSKELSFFVFKKGCDDMLNIIKEELDLSPDLKKKINLVNKNLLGDWEKNSKKQILINKQNLKRHVKFI